MIGLLCFVVAVLTSPIKAKIRLEAENAALRHQLVVLQRQLKGRARLTNDDRWFFVQLYRWFPSILPALMIIRPETLVRWHRAGFRRYKDSAAPGMGNQHSWAILQRQCAAGRSDRICEGGQRILHRGDLQARGLKARDHFGPARAVRPRSVYQHNVRASTGVAVWA